MGNEERQYLHSLLAVVPRPDTHASDLHLVMPLIDIDDHLPLYDLGSRHPRPVKPIQKFFNNTIIIILVPC